MSNTPEFTCRLCGERKPYDRAHFTPSGMRLGRTCRTCSNKRAKGYREKLIAERDTMLARGDDAEIEAFVRERWKDRRAVTADMLRRYAPELLEKVRAIENAVHDRRRQENLEAGLCVNGKVRRRYRVDPDAMLAKYQAKYDKETDKVARRRLKQRIRYWGDHEDRKKNLDRMDVYNQKRSRKNTDGR